jgi:DNA-binding protein HU-beta
LLASRRKKASRAEHSPLTRAALARAVARDVGIPQVQAELAVRHIFIAISDALRDGEAVRLAKFGTFSIAKNAARNAKTERRGKRTAAATAQPEFRAAKSLREAVVD